MCTRLYGFACDTWTQAPDKPAPVTHKTLKVQLNANRCYPLATQLESNQSSRVFEYVLCVWDFFSLFSSESLALLGAGWFFVSRLPQSGGVSTKVVLGALIVVVSIDSSDRYWRGEISLITSRIVRVLFKRRLCFARHDRLFAPINILAGPIVLFEFVWLGVRKYWLCIWGQIGVKGRSCGLRLAFNVHFKLNITTD